MKKNRNLTTSLSLFTKEFPNTPDTYFLKIPPILCPYNRQNCFIKSLSLITLTYNGKKIIKAKDISRNSRILELVFTCINYLSKNGSTHDEGSISSSRTKSPLLEGVLYRNVYYWILLRVAQVLLNNYFWFYSSRSKLMFCLKHLHWQKACGNTYASSECDASPLQVTSKNFLNIP